MTITTLEPSKPKRKSPTDLSHLTAEEKKERKKAYYKTYAKENRSELNERTAAWKKLNPERHKSHTLKYRYGITLEERDALLESQGSSCAVCSTKTPDKNGWLVDHCHETDVVRGILCHSCNIGLGLFKDNPATLAAAITYLGKQNG